MNFLNSVISDQGSKAARYLSNQSKRPKPQSLVAVPSGYDAVTGRYLATTPDGGTVPYSLGNYTRQPDTINVLIGSNSLVGFGDYRA